MEIEETTEIVEAKDVVTEKTFAELTTDEVKGLDDEQTELYAKSQGWHKDFRGDPSKAKTAKQFLEDGKNELPIIRANNKKLIEDNDKLRKEMSNNSKIILDKMERQEARHKKELERSIKASEIKIDKAKTDFDVDTATKETENLVTMKNELNELEDTSKQDAAQEEQRYKVRLDEWNNWLGSAESLELQAGNGKDFALFRQEVAYLDAQNRNASVSEIIQKAKSTIYSQAPNIQGANPSKTKSNTLSISKEDRDWINSNIQNETQIMKNRGVSDKEIKEYTKKQTKYYEAKLAEGEEDDK